MKKIVFVLLTITLLYSTTITGNIINGDSLEKMGNTLITVENDNGAIIVQKFFNNEYLVNVPSGAYLMRAYHYCNGTVDYYNQYNVQVTQEQMNFDIVLLPYELAQLIPDYTPPPLADEKKVNKIELGNEIIIYFVVIAVIIGAFYFMYIKRKTITEKIAEKETSSETEQTHELDDDCKKALEIIKGNEGRMVQKELREIMNFSETKMSLMISELEACGKIKRIKKGRENILKLVSK